VGWGDRDEGNRLLGRVRYFSLRKKYPSSWLTFDDENFGYQTFNFDNAIVCFSFTLIVILCPLNCFPFDMDENPNDQTPHVLTIKKKKNSIKYFIGF